MGMRPEWMDSTDPAPNCKHDTDAFYPNRPSSEVAKAKARCNGFKKVVKDPNTGIKRLLIEGPCPFLTECLHYAIDNKESHGVWGGTSERDRRKIWKIRRRSKNLRIYDLEGVQFPGVVEVEIRKSAAS